MDLELSQKAMKHGVAILLLAVVGLALLPRPRSTTWVYYRAGCDTGQWNLIGKVTIFRAVEGAEIEFKDPCGCGGHWMTLRDGQAEDDFAGGPSDGLRHGAGQVFAQPGRRQSFPSGLAIPFDSGLLP